MDKYEFTPAHVGRLCAVIAKVGKRDVYQMCGCPSTDGMIDFIELAVDRLMQEECSRREALDSLYTELRAMAERRKAVADAPSH